MTITTPTTLVDYVKKQKIEGGYELLSSKLFSSVNGSMENYSAFANRPRSDVLFDARAETEATLTYEDNKKKKKVIGLTFQKISLEDLTDSLNSKINSTVSDTIVDTVEKVTGLKLLYESVENHNANYVFGKTCVTKGKDEKEEKQEVDELYVECLVVPYGREGYKTVLNLTTRGSAKELKTNEFKQLVDGLTLAMLYLRETRDMKPEEINHQEERFKELDRKREENGQKKGPSFLYSHNESE